MWLEDIYSAFASAFTFCSLYLALQCMEICTFVLYYIVLYLHGLYSGKMSKTPASNKAGINMVYIVLCFPLLQNIIFQK
jgi:hypothetical protein